MCCDVLLELFTTEHLPLDDGTTEKRFCCCHRVFITAHNSAAPKCSQDLLSESNSNEWTFAPSSKKGQISWKKTSGIPVMSIRHPPARHPPTRAFFFFCKRGCVCTCTPTDARPWTGGWLAVGAINPSRACLWICGCESPRSRVMCVRLAPSAPVSGWSHYKR